MTEKVYTSEDIYIRRLGFSLPQRTQAMIKVYCAMLGVNASGMVNTALGSRIYQLISEQSDEFQGKFKAYLLTAEHAVIDADADGKLSKLDDGWPEDLLAFIPDSPKYAWDDANDYSEPATRPGSAVKYSCMVSGRTEFEVRLFCRMTGATLSDVSARLIQRQCRHIMGNERRDPDGEDWAAFCRVVIRRLDEERGK